MSEPSSHVALAVGDRVVYPNQGVCRVTAIDAKSVAGQTLTFVSLKREEDGALVMVPEAKVLAIGVRRVASAEEVKKIFAFLSADTEKADLDWKQRARTNVERMALGRRRDNRPVHRVKLGPGRHRVRALPLGRAARAPGRRRRQRPHPPRNRPGLTSTGPEGHGDPRRAGPRTEARAGRARAGRGGRP